MFFQTPSKIQILIPFPHFLSDQTQAQVEGEKKRISQKHKPNPPKCTQPEMT